ncbi:DUF481 domain-containing protein [Desulfohalovibrio reitneri]|uniref:DUF481 domain-containing protein n=1 Tax=Desulfohalovibrio reitneri TaxID=1307759 RepID=UPI0004A6BEC1|nr:DUF481 domain-containing protein [Desulfohalovibrio reitneri]
MPIRIAALLAAVLVLTPFAARADTLLMANGDRLTGALVRMEKGKLLFETEYAGEVSVSWDKVERLETDKPVAVYGKDDSEWQASSISPGENVVSVATDPDAWRVKGRLGAGWDKANGNTETESVHGEGEITARKGDNRYKGYGEHNWAADSGSTIESNWLLRTSYDRFLSKRFFIGASGSAEADHEADLERRLALGGHAGYVILDSGRWNWEMQGGPAYIWENYQNGKADEEFPAGQASSEFSFWIWPGRAQLFQVSHGFVSFKESEEAVAQTRQGIRFPLGNGFDLSFRYDYDWRNDPPPEQTRWDERYYLTLGWSFGGL